VNTKTALQITVGLLAIPLAIGVAKSNSEKDRKLQAIETCWHDQSSKAFASGPMRFEATPCEAMEADFVRAYGVQALMSSS
jgi:hypothetical protein